MNMNVQGSTQNKVEHFISLFTHLQCRKISTKLRVGGVVGILIAPVRRCTRNVDWNFKN